MQEEIWKDIPNYEGIYQVSNLGNVKSLGRFVKRKSHRLYIPFRLLKPYKNSIGYYNCNLYKNNSIRTFTLHQLVAIAFLNHIPDGTQELVVDHINNNRLDNRLENLQIITQRENANRKHLESTSKYVGVCFVKERNKWTAQIVVNRKKVWLGSFEHEIDAHISYQNKLKELKLINPF